MIDSGLRPGYRAVELSSGSNVISRRAHPGLALLRLMEDGGVQGRRMWNLPGREAGPPHHHDDEADLEQ